MSKTGGLIDGFTSSLAAVRALAADVSDCSSLDDTSFTVLLSQAAELQQLAGTVSAVLAGELAHRSRPELGKQGLAQREAHRTPELMLVATTGVGAKDARTAVAVGRLAREAAAGAIPDPLSGDIITSARPWLDQVGLAVAAGTLSVEKALSIATGLGDPTEAITVDALTAAVATLLAEAPELDVDRLWRRARDLRDDIDHTEVARREAQQRSERELFLARNRDGTAKLIWKMDPETAATVGDLYDRATSPRLGGGRVAFTDQETEKRILDDSRTTGQLASDTFLQLLAAGADADSSQLLGSGGPQVSIIVREEDLTARTGHALFQETGQPLSISTVERMICNGSTITITKGSDGQPLDAGREQRLFNRKQRRALAARDGGCRAPGCTRPPSFTEAHHTNPWQRDHGRTDIADGILLCKHHHLLFHNNGWEITRTGTQYWLIPPPDIDPTQTPRPMPSHNPLWEPTGRSATTLTSGRPAKEPRAIEDAEHAS